MNIYKDLNPNQIMIMVAINYYKYDNFKPKTHDNIKRLLTNKRVGENIFNRDGFLDTHLWFLEHDNIITKVNGAYELLIEFDVKERLNHMLLMCFSSGIISSEAIKLYFNMIHEENKDRNICDIALECKIPLCMINDYLEEMEECFLIKLK